MLAKLSTVIHKTMWNILYHLNVYVLYFVLTYKGIFHEFLSKKTRINVFNLELKILNRSNNVHVMMYTTQVGSREIIVYQPDSWYRDVKTRKNKPNNNIMYSPIAELSTVLPQHTHSLKIILGHLYRRVPQW